MEQNQSESLQQLAKPRPFLMQYKDTDCISYIL